MNPKRTRWKLTSPLGTFIVWASSLDEAMQTDCAATLMGEGPVFHPILSETVPPSNPRVFIGTIVPTP